MIDDLHSVFNPTAYHFGSVWPLFTGWTALAEYQVGRYNQGFSHIMSNMLNYKGISHGRFPEVINGLVYKPSGVTLHQCWSETMVLQPTVEGMLGFIPDAMNKRMVLAPRLPFHWNSLQVKNLRMADASLSLDMTKGKGKQVYNLSSTRPVTVDFRPMLAPGTQVEQIRVNGEKATYELLANREYVVIDLAVALDKNASVEITFREGMSAQPAYRLSQYEEMSKGIHVISQCVANGVLEIVVEGCSETTCQLDLYLPDGYERVEGTSSEVKNANGVYTFNVNFEKAKEAYVTKTIKVYPSK